MTAAEPEETPDVWAREIVASMTPPDQETLDRLAELLAPDPGAVIARVARHM